MIILNLKDGLGNQLFEYAYARQIQLKYNEKIGINTYFFNRLKDRTPSLQYFRLNPNVFFLNKKQELFYTALFYLRLISCLGVKKLYKWIFRGQRPKNDDNFLEYASKGLFYSFITFNDCNYPQPNKKTNFIHGNFESKKYIAGLESVINNEFRLKDNLTQQQKDVLEIITQSNAVCVHIRRGDYLDPKWAAFNVCNYEYYQQGMDEIYKLVKDPVFFIFSNTHKDIEWIKENFKWKEYMKIQFVDCNGTDTQDFELMKNCKHFIISNSTYSWWAANLSVNEKKIVVAPKVWYKAAVNCENMYFDNWIRI